MTHLHVDHTSGMRLLPNATFICAREEWVATRARLGDAAYTLRSIREQILPMITADDTASLESLRELKAFSEREPEAILVPTHDPEAWHQLRQ